jgi:exopolysaccharide production protein ExoQ
MSSTLAAAAFALGIAALFYLDRDQDTRTSPALWLAVIWMAIGASRMLSQWLGGLPVKPTEESVYLDGSPVDRLFLSVLLGGALCVLLARAAQTGRLLRANGPLVIFFLYCAVSVLWSDYPFVAFKRWTKALGNVAIVMVILTDPDPRAAVKRALAQTGFLLIPLSILYIKYFPALGRTYNRWTWTSWNVGVSTDKNGLGALCVVFGLASLWRLLEELRDAANPSHRRVLIAHGAVIGMVLWLLIRAASSTSLVCFALGAMVLLLTTRPGGFRPATVHLVTATVVVAGIISSALPALYGYAVEELGRNTTLTGRTEIWDELFRMTENRLLGTGFESFWMGSRVDHLWSMYYFHPNQAHNGYIETYINLGWAGVALLILLIVMGYRNILRMERGYAGSLCFTYFVVALVYNITEAAFKVMHPMWIAFLFAVAAGAALSNPGEELEPATLHFTSAERHAVLLHASTDTP